VTLIVSLVALGFGIVGALAGGIAASGASLALTRRWIRPSVLGRGAPLKPILAFALPLFLAGTAGMLTRRLDLMTLKAMGATAATAGLYSAAQTLAVIPGILVSALAPLLLSSMNNAYSDGRADHAKKLGRDFLRGGLWLFPMAGLVAGASSDITLLAYGPEFKRAGPVLAVLFFGGTSALLGTTCHAVMMVMDRTRAILWTSVVPLLVAVALYPLLIPRFGSLGAACSTLSGAGAGQAIALVVVWQLWRVAPPPGTVLRAATLTAGAFWLSYLWETSSLWVLPKLMSLTLLVPLGFLVLGEFTRSEIREGVLFLRVRFKRPVEPFRKRRAE
jgi:O-antigen/teichoic acid export membrane protein